MRFFQPTVTITLRQVLKDWAGQRRFRYTSDENEIASGDANLYLEAYLGAIEEAARLVLGNHESLSDGNLVRFIRFSVDAGLEIDLMEEFPDAYARFDSYKYSEPDLESAS